MAQTKRKRRSKHRGNAAGMVESRGRTGRRPLNAEKGKRPTSKERGATRYDRPPTWKGAFKRAAIAAAAFLVLLLILYRKVEVAVPLAVIMVGVYAPFGYYVDGIMYRRTQRRKAAGSGGHARAKR